MAPEIKFCGLTREVDARQAVALGAAYLGVIFAGGPRKLDVGRARMVLGAAAGGTAKRVGVFGADPPEQIASLASELELDVAQLHTTRTARELSRLRAQFGGAIWLVLPIGDAALPPEAETVFALGDAVLLDKRDGSRVGGTGVAFDWEAVAPALQRIRGATPVVLAGGLNPENVERATRVIAPAVVDVSSGVESGPGIKDHARMRAFAHAVGRLKADDERR